MNSLSVLIPTYNYDCSDLIRTIANQLLEGEELLVADDGSTDQQAKERNRLTCNEMGARWLEMPTNLGRAAIRNRLAREAKGEWLLFIDNDSVVRDGDYLKRFRIEMQAQNTKLEGKSVKVKATVFCGILLNPATLPSPQQSLRYYYEEKYAHPNHHQRNEHPYANFRTSHFMIRRDTMLAYPLDERFKAYGYEDTLYGMKLKEERIPVRHCHVYVVNGDLEDNATFLDKTEQQLHTLYTFRTDLAECSTLLHTYARLRKLCLLPVVRLAYRLLHTSIRRNLLGNHPSITLYQFYKLGFYDAIAIKG